jgi:CBS domain-containing protein
MVNVNEIMSTTVETIGKDESTFSAAEKMTSKGISCLIVMEGETLVGIITRRDILEKVLVQMKDPKETKVSDVMSSPVMTVTSDKEMTAVIGIMKINHIKQVPIVEGEKMVGIVTQTDFVKKINTIMGM